jgi:hypothetical protein
MANYIFQLRQGTRYVDKNGATLLKPDGTPVRDDWSTYTAQEGHLDPLEGELVLEYEEVRETGKKIPRLKIGDGINVFADLEYMSIDSFILPKQISVTLYGSEDVENADKPQWEEERDSEGNFLGRYKQLVTINNAVITPNSKIDLNPTPDMLAIFHEKDATFVAENDNGIVTVYCVGQKPKNTYIEIPVTVTEVVYNG